MPPHLKAQEEIERMGMPGLLGVLSEEGLDAVRKVLWDATGHRREYDPLAWRNRTTEGQKRIEWEMTVRIEKILCTVQDREDPLHGAS
jgi:uncharacterized protein (UPF0248 family)